jgi:predicted peptidase
MQGYHETGMRKIPHLFAPLILLVAAGCASTEQWTLATGQHPQSYQKEITKTVSGRFLLYLPKPFGQEKKNWPLVIFLHGSGERGDDLEKVKVHGPPKLVAQQQEFPFILVSPQAPADELWDIEKLNALLDEVIARLPIDTEQVYLTGLSMGGHGTWNFACAYPQRFAAIAPVCGAGDPDRACRLKNLAVWAFHGAKDPVVDPNDDQKMVDAVKACGGDIKFTVYPDAGHDAWTETYNDPELYGWLMKHRRKR